MRVGAFALSLLSTPLHAEVVKALRSGPRPLTDLRRSTGSPPQTTLRNHLRKLEGLGLVERSQLNDFPGSVSCELSGSGRDFLEVTDAVEAWLRASPAGPLELGAPAAKSSLKALVGGWESGVVRALASKPLTLTELSRLITGLSYPSLERRLGAMRLADLIAPLPGCSRGTPYGVTTWLREAVVPLLAAARWERQSIPEESSKIGKIDVEAAFLLALPAIRLSSDVSGTCRLSVENDGNGNGEAPRAAGAMVEVESGRILRCRSRLDSGACSWASGTAGQWLLAVIDSDTALDLGGDAHLAGAVVDGLRTTYRRAAHGGGTRRSAESAALVQSSPSRP